MAEQHRAERGQDRKVHVTAVYTATADEKRFVAEPERTVAEVIVEAYSKLGESRRPGDQYFCHQEPRLDLAPYQQLTLQQLGERRLCLLDNGHGQQEFLLDIDVEPGGACR